MTSRSLWLLLTLLATPLILYSTTGCEIVFPLVDPGPTTNAYICQCSCTPPRDVATPVGVGNDDAEENRTDGNVLLGGNDLRMTSQFLVGVRFAALGIPQAATIESAYVQFTSAQTDPNPATVAIRIEAADDAAPFAATATNVSGRLSVIAPVVWTSGAWANNDQGTAQQTPDLSASIKSVVDRPLWTTASSLVLIFDATSGSRIAASANAAGNRAPVLHLVYSSDGETFKADIPVCLAEVDNPVVTPGAGNPDTDGDGNDVPDLLEGDCANRVTNTFKGMIDACGIVADAADHCGCHIVPTGTHADTGDEYFGFTREVCNTQPEVCPEVPVDTTPGSECSNFDPTAFNLCRETELDGCEQNSIPPEDCNLDDCLQFVAATNAEDAGEPICVAHASEGPQPFAFQLLGRRSTCEVSGITEIQVGDEAREPKQQPFTQGTIEIIGGPCPGAECAVGISTQLAMNSVTFAVSWAKDPTFSNLIEAGNSSLSAASLSSLGAGNVAVGTTANVGRGQRGSSKKAFLGSNDVPLGLTVNWGGFACSLDGNLAGGVEAEGAAGTCDGDETVECFASSPDCDGVGGPCNLPADTQQMVVNVSLAGTLVNQPPTADAGDETVECTSPAGASFALDSADSTDPDGDIRILSWRLGTRVGPEVGFHPQLPVSVGVGQSQDYVLRVIDRFGQADEDGATAAVVDTTPPDVFCNAPATIVPPKKPVSFSATASDVCTVSVVPQLLDLECFKINGAGKVIDKKCKVTLNGPTITINNTGGVGQHIAWTARGVDGSGNVREVPCEVVVANPGHS